jgi:PAS domain S-box-containing protein
MDASAVEFSPDRLHTILEDGEFVLCRGSDPSDTASPSPSRLVVMPRSPHPRPQTVHMLEHEHSLRDELDPAWAVRPLALRTHDGRTALACEDPGGEPLIHRTGTPMETGDCLRVGAGLAAALRQLHGRGLIHKDIKPANVMIDWATDRVWVRGFGIASRLARERRFPEPPEFISGTLAYMAPEQTGWMNRSIDTRSDLYALGVVLYELLTGSLPFTASDPMAWVHCHIARRPVPPTERLHEVPGVVSAIVMKLLAKTAEDRYQTAAGVEWALRRCLTQWEAEHRIDEFPPAEHDTPDRLLIPEKLYGRAAEIDVLLDAFERVVTSGMPELVLVSGYSGIGKSSVVNELHRVLVPPRGLFASGKFDQYKRDIPYATLAQAFQGLVRRLLGKSEAELAPWRDAFREALGANGRLMIELVPELTHIIGEQPPVPDLPPQDARRRFQLVFRRFIGVFARPEHPLALFLDDLQWLDAATLDLLEDLLTPPGVAHLMLIGAYRDNEVTAAHPLMRTLDAIRKAGAHVREIALAPLAIDDGAQLIADALRGDPERVAPLAQLVHEKTAGNPFFTIQFLSSLAEERLLVFDHEAARWSWDLDRIHAVGYTDNVVDLMVGKLARLPADTRHALQRLAGLGNSANDARLSIVFGTCDEHVHTVLWPAVRQELVERMPDAYRFIHDRVQEAAYALIPEDERPAEHLRIGRLLATHTPPETIAEHVFEIVSQFNRGAVLITSTDEREQVAELNLIAGKRAKASSAYASALTYLTAGSALLRDDTWERRQALAFALELHRADCELWTGALPSADGRLEALAARACDVVQRAAVASRRVDLSTMLGATDRALAVGLECLRHAGIDWAAHPTELDARREYERIWAQLGSRAIEELIDLPLMQDPESLATLDVLTALGPPTFYTDDNLHALSSCRAVNLSLERGNSDAAAAHYASVGLMAAVRFGDYDAGYRLAKMACDLTERRGLKRFGGQTYSVFAVVVPWTRPMRESINPARRAFQMASERGDPTYAAYACWNLTSGLLTAGEPLDQVEREAEHGLAFARTVQFGFVADLIFAPLALVRTLRGETAAFGVLDNGRFTEGSFEERLTGHPALALPECFYWIRKLQARFFAGDFASAVDAAERVERWHSRSASLSVFLLEKAEYHLYAALSRAACCEPSGPDPYARHREALAAHDRQLRTWAANCPENFEDRTALVGAEIARLEGRMLDAEQLYEQAIRSARKRGFVQNEGLAYELAARFYAARGLEPFADLYLRHARHCYQRWGADGKVRQLDELYPRLRDTEPAPDSRNTIGAPVEQLELATVLKVSQAVSGEIALDKLVETILRTAIEHAGAERGVLIVPQGDDQGDDLRIQAEARTNGNGSAIPLVLRDVPISSADLPESVARYAARARERVSLEDASARGGFSDDEYIRREHARSILCLPLLRQGQLMALLYLENNLAAGVFTPSRMAVLNVLASQAAMSLEKTRLYHELEQREAKIRRLVDANIIGILTYDLSGRIIDANDAFLRMVGYDHEDLVSGRLRWTDLTPPEWRERDQHRLVQLKISGRLQPVEKEYFRKDGTRVPVLIGLANYEIGASEGVAFVLDLTERKQAEQARERAETELRQAQAALAHRQRVSLLGEVAASLAHEIKQPIAAARIDATTCLRALADNRLDVQEARKSASRMIKDVTWADEIINRTTALYKKDTTQRERLDIRTLIDGMAFLLQRDAGAYAISIRTEHAEGIPDILADRVQLQQVFMNLMLNAIEAMRDTGGELTITSAVSEGRQLVISVSDTGVGLPTENPDTIFDAFVTTKPQGTGMGLAITRSIVEAHGGRLWAIANTGAGATFFFTLPSE